MGKHTSRVVGAKYRNAPEWLLQQLRDRREVTSEECWLWPAYINRDGYGVVMYTARREDGTAYRPQLMVHRLAYMRFVTDLDDSQQVDHTCHDPAVCLERGKDCLHRRCYNPEHLEPVAGLINLMRSGNFTPLNAAKTHCVRGHPLEGQNLRFAPDGSRVCRACKAMHAANANAAAKAARRAAVPPRACETCGADINHRSLKARFCEQCRPAKTREAELGSDLLLFR